MLLSSWVMMANMLSAVLFDSILDVSLWFKATSISTFATSFYRTKSVSSLLLSVVIFDTGMTWKTSVISYYVSTFKKLLMPACVDRTQL